MPDGLRLFVNGHPDQPVTDVEPGDDPEDSGQKGMSYRAVPIHRGQPPRGEDPGTPILRAGRDQRVWLRVVGVGVFRWGTEQDIWALLRVP